MECKRVQHKFMFSGEVLPLPGTAKKKINTDNYINLSTLEFVKQLGQVEKYNWNGKYGRSRTRPEKGFIYIIRSKHLSKIGRTVDVAKRLGTFLCHNPFIDEILVYPVSDTVNAEHEMNIRYEKYRLQLEWFLIPKDELEKLKLIFNTYEPFCNSVKHLVCDNAI